MCPGSFCQISDGICCFAFHGFVEINEGKKKNVKCYSHGENMAYTEYFVRQFLKTVAREEKGVGL